MTRRHDNRGRPPSAPAPTRGTSRTQALAISAVCAFGVVVGLVLLAGRADPQQGQPDGDGSWMRRLQILMGRPAPFPQPPSDPVVLVADRTGTPESRLQIDALDAELRDMTALLRRARFHQVIEAGEPLRRQLSDAQNLALVGGRIARLEVMTATAELALGRTQDATLSLERALRADGGLELDPQRSPPKLRRLLASVRRTR